MAFTVTHWEVMVQAVVQEAADLEVALQVEVTLCKILLLQGQHVEDLMSMHLSVQVHQHLTVRLVEKAVLLSLVHSLQPIWVLCVHLFYL